MLRAALKLRHEGLEGLFGVAKQHAGVVEIEEFVFNAGKTCRHRTFKDENGPGFVGVDDRHSVDGA